MVWWVAFGSIWVRANHELQRLKKSLAGVKVYLDHSTGDLKASEEVLEETFKLCAELGITVVAARDLPVPKYCEAQSGDAVP